MKLGEVYCEDMMPAELVWIRVGCRHFRFGISSFYEITSKYTVISVPVLSNFHFSMSSGPALGSTQPPIKWVSGTKLQGPEADHSPPTSAEIKKMWIYTSTPPYVFMAECLIS
jgi:hypothetical protein